MVSIKIIFISFLSFITQEINFYFNLGTRRDVFFGCTGLLVGGVIGFSVGIAIRKHQPLLRYMQAIQFNKSTQVTSSLKSYN